MDSIKVPLVLNKLESKEIYDYLSDNGMIGVNELYLIQNDNEDFVDSVEYDTTNNKLTYTDTNGIVHDIVNVSVIKTAMSLSSVATSGNYNDLSNTPKINNVSLTGNKTTADLLISYNDLSDQPDIPTVTSAYSSTDTANAINGAGVNNALQNYVQNSVSITGTGALGGGGTLTQNRTITHNQAPTNLTTGAVKVGADTYGHVQIGANITAVDVNAIPCMSNSVGGVSSIPTNGYSVIVALCSQNETITFSDTPPVGCNINIYCVNVTSNTITITCNQEICQNDNNVFVDGTSNSSKQISIAQNKCAKIQYCRGSYTESGTTKYVGFATITEPQ